jgi:hypothetical protein
MTYEIVWFAQMSFYVALFVETIKRNGGQWLRDNIPAFEPFYPLAVKVIALAAPVIMCFVAKADALATLEIYGFRSEVGYVVGGILVFGGDTLIDAVWDKRKTLEELIKVFKPALVARTSSSISNTEALCS